MIETLWEQIKMSDKWWKPIAGYRSLKYKNCENQLIPQIRCKKVLSVPTIDPIDELPELTGIPNSA